MKTQKVKTRNTIFKIEPYHGDIMISVGETEAQVMDRIKLSGYVLDDEDKSHIDFSHKVGKCLMLKGGQTILWLSRFNGDRFSICTLAHELFHAVCFKLDHVGVEFCEESEESYAYLLDWMMNKTLSFLEG